MKRREPKKEVQLWEEVLQNMKQPNSGGSSYLKHSTDYMQHSHMVVYDNVTSEDKLQHIMSCHPIHKKLSKYLFDEL